MKRFMVTGMRGTRQWICECDTLLEAKEHAYLEVSQDEIALVYDMTTEEVIFELRPRYDGLGVS